MKPSLRQQFERLALRLSELDARLADPGVATDIGRLRTLAKEQAEAAGVVARFRRYEQREKDRAAAQELLADPEMAEMARDEIADADADLARLSGELQAALLPRDADDDRNAFIEIRAGTGGDESALFAGDLFRMYVRYAERQRWAVELISESQSELGGYKEVVARFAGQGVYSKMKFESGGHRVQRVPETEAQGRIHTSACTVAVLPEAEAVDDVQLNPAELRIDTFRASGAGGQHVNKTESAIRVTHLPTGIVVECQDSRSQHKNREKALGVLAARIKDRREREIAAKTASTRKSLIGSGDRSERIRTYNFPQNRVTDHRMGLTLYNLDRIIEGDLDDLVGQVGAHFQAEIVAGLSAEA